ncbi:MAG: glycosyl transferase [Geobacteraceae bacterium GWC2_58_44]|nr:MAG: glycosyl transferase [Geobacteraceae bacterium GWC2_58_44]HBG05127.1 glycosyl transferase [Geobacter sp.]
MSFEQRPELSVIVPVINEETNIAPFLGALALQREVRMELIISDGGSDDDSVAQATRISAGLPFPVRVIEGARGRGGQMNLAAGVARAEKLLFLHIDSSFPDPLSFRKGLDALAAGARGGNARVAGHFALEFHFETEPPLPYRFYGAKARLDRPGCTHGDQGFLIGADFFAEIGPFDTTLPLMEDTFLAERIRQSGTWLLLPSRIKTSPRRFLGEGLLPRQTLNAILMDLAAIGHLGLLQSLRESYRSQHAARRLRLGPFLVPLREGIAALPRAERRRLWYQTGAYVRSNAWQIPFFLDLYFGKGEAGGGIFLALHDRFLARLIDNRVGNWVTAGLVWAWFRLTLILSD